MRYSSCVVPVTAFAEHILSIGIPGTSAAEAMPAKPAGRAQKLRLVSKCFILSFLLLVQRSFDAFSCAEPNAGVPQPAGNYVEYTLRDIKLKWHFHTLT